MDDHKEIKPDTAERYILGELNREESDAFEEHYFGCVECVRAGVGENRRRLTPRQTSWRSTSSEPNALGMGRRGVDVRDRACL